MNKQKAYDNYTPLYASGHQAQLVDGDVFRIIIPNPDGGLLSDQVGGKVSGLPLKLLMTMDGAKRCWSK